MAKKQMLGFLAFLSLILFYPLENCLSYTYISINNGQNTTKLRSVNLYINPPANVSQMMISNDVNFSGSNWESFKQNKSWYLTAGSGTKTVYVKFLNSSNLTSQTYSDSIQLSALPQMIVDFKINSSTPETNNRNVNLDLSWSESVEFIRISNDNNFGSSNWIPVSKNILWQLSPGSGNKTVYIEFKDLNETIKKVSKSIKYVQPDNYINEGSLIKGKSSTIYYLGFDGKLHPFFNSAIFHSWYQDFSGISQVSDAKIKQYSIGQPVCVRQGTWLVKFKGQSKIYAVEPGCVLRQIRSEVEAKMLYGQNWSKRVLILNPILQSFYTILGQENSNQNDDNDIDNDGLDKKTESDYGSSDTKIDTDADGLSDFEEVTYWFTDPNAVDTDSDGVKDGKEVISGNLPTGPGKISSLPNGAYKHVVGSLIRKTNGVYYYRAYNGTYYRVSDQAFGTNRLQKRFAITDPNYNLNFSSNGNLGNGDPKVNRPQIRNSSGNLIDL